MLFNLALTFIVPVVATFFAPHILAASLGVGLIALDPLSLTVLGALAVETTPPPEEVLAHAARLQRFTWLGIGFLAVAAVLYGLRSRFPTRPAKAAAWAMYLGILISAAASVMSLRAFFDPANATGALPGWTGPVSYAGMALTAGGAVALAVLIARAVTRTSGR